METKMAADFTDASQWVKAHMQTLDRMYANKAVEEQAPLAALDASLEQAVQNVQRDSRFQIRKTSQGRYAVFGPGDFFDESHNKAYMEAIAAFFAGDLIEALEKRQAFIDSFVVAP